MGRAGRNTCIGREDAETQFADWINDFAQAHSLDARSFTRKRLVQVPFFAFTHHTGRSNTEMDGIVDKGTKAQAKAISIGHVSPESNPWRFLGQCMQPYIGSWQQCEA